MRVKFHPITTLNDSYESSDYSLYLKYAYVEFSEPATIKITSFVGAVVLLWRNQNATDFSKVAIVTIKYQHQTLG